MHARAYLQVLWLLPALHCASEVPAPAAARDEPDASDGTALDGSQPAEPDGQDGSVLPGKPDASDARTLEDAPSETSLPAHVEGRLRVDGSVQIVGTLADDALGLIVGDELLAWSPASDGRARLTSKLSSLTDSYATTGGFLTLTMRDEVATSSTLLFWSRALGVGAASARDFPLVVGSRDGKRLAAFVLDPSRWDRVDLHVYEAATKAPWVVEKSMVFGAVGSACEPWAYHTSKMLLVRGCAAGSSTASLTAYPADRSSPGSVAVRGASSEALVAPDEDTFVVGTSKETFVRSLSGKFEPVSVTGPASRMRMARSGANVAHLHTTGELSTIQLAAPFTRTRLVPRATDLLGISDDGRYVALATTGTSDKGLTDLVVIDTSTLATQTLATQSSTFVGFAGGSAAVVFLAERRSFGGVGNLRCSSPSGGTVTTWSTSTAFASVVGSSVYFLEAAANQLSLGLARACAPEKATLGQAGEYHLGSQVVPLGAKAYVSGRTGLWEFAGLVD